MKENIEIWADIAGYEGLYQVSNLGQVRSLDKLMKGNAPKQGYILRKGRILKPGLDGKGYQFVYLYKDGKGKMHKVHRLVANAFIPNPKQLPQVNHLDEVKTNNRVNNLEWCTNEYNYNYGTRIERVSKANTNGKKSKQVAQINPQTNEIIRIWPSTAECERNGFKQSSVAACCRGERNFHHGYKWRYID